MQSSEQRTGVESHEKLFTGKVILITGASKPDGIGAATARLFAKEGAAAIIISGRVGSEEGAQEVLAELQLLGTEPVWAPGDVTDPRTASKLINGARAYQKLDVIVNNAGILSDEGMAKMTIDEWDKVIATNLTPSFLTVREAVVQKMFPPEGGAVVNVSSIVGLYGNEGQINYAAAKAGLVGITKTQAKELGPKGIRVNAVAPGLVITEMTRKKFDRDAVRAAVEQLTPMRRVGTPEDIARVIKFLASPDAAFVTGQTIEVDGGINGSIGAIEALTRANMRLAMLKQAKQGVSN